MGAGDAFFEEVEVFGEGEGARLWRGMVGLLLCDGAEEQDVAGVAASGFETGFDAVGGVVVGGNEDDGALWAGGAV